VIGPVLGTALAVTWSNATIMGTIKHIIIAAVLGAPLLIGCSSNTPEEQSKEMQERMNDATEDLDDAAAKAGQELERERIALVQELQDLRNSIEKSLNDTEKDLADKDIKAEDRTKAENMKVELERELKVVDDAIADVRKADKTTWEEVKLRGRNTVNDVEAWWKRQKENVDRNTDADRDSDGH
jgi:outer membrane murein-binding lipoprotein Lpp